MEKKVGKKENRVSFPHTDQGEAGKNLGSGGRLPESKSWLWFLLSVTLSALLTSYGLGFLICKLGFIRAVTLSGCWED